MNYNIKYIANGYSFEQSFLSLNPLRAGISLIVGRASSTLNHYVHKYILITSNGFKKKKQSNIKN